MTVLHRPGHSPSDTLLWDEQRALAIGGDHLIKHISSNPLISRPLGGKSGEPGGGRPRALMIYLGSLRETREMPLELVLAGHGEPVTDHARLIAERPRSAYELAQEMWGNVAVTQAYLALSEVLGHVDLLVDRGEVIEREL